MRHTTWIKLAGAVLAVAIGAPAFAQTPVKFALNYQVNEAHIAYWVALEKGYYKSKGLDVVIEYSKGSGDAISKADAGRADVALADAMAVVPALARGAKVKIIGMVMDKSPLNIFVWDDSPIKTPKDLEGKTLAAPPGDAQRVLFKAFAESVGVDSSKVSWLNVDPAAKVPALVGKRVDGVGTYYTDLPMFEKGMGKGKVRSMRWSDFNFDPYSISIIANEQTIRSKPDMLKAFLEASYMGWRDALANMDEAITIFKKRVPELDQPVARAAMPMVYDLLASKRYEEHGIGWIDQQKMCRTVNLVNGNMDLPRKPSCEEVYTSALLPVVKPVQSR